MPVSSTVRRLQHGEPARCRGWLSVRLKQFGRYTRHFATLDGPVLRLARTQNDQPTVEIDVLNSRLYRFSRKDHWVIRLTLMSQVLVSVLIKNAEDYKRWALALENAVSRHIETFYEIGQNIAEGAFSSVVCGADIETRAQVAIKAVDREQCSAPMLAFVENEVRVLRRLQHDNIVSLRDVFETAGFLYLVLGYARFGTLESFLSDPSALGGKVIRDLMWQLFSALHCLHSSGLVHRDIKPENILVDRLEPINVRLADFGFAASYHEKPLNAMLGTVAFMSPEMLRREDYDSSVDLWAAGVTLYRLLAGSLPFGDDAKTTCREAISGLTKRHEDALSYLSPDAVSLLRGLLQVSPSKRLSAAGAMCHRFFTGHLPEPRPRRWRLRCVATAIVAGLRMVVPHGQDYEHRRGNSAEYCNTPRSTPKKLRQYTVRRTSRGDQLGAHLRSTKAASASDLSDMGHHRDSSESTVGTQTDDDSCVSGSETTSSLHGFFKGPGSTRSQRVSEEGLASRRKLRLRISWQFD